MMNKILLLGLLVTPALWAQDASEEALILNQELQFLEESANNVSVAIRSQPTAPDSPTGERTRAIVETGSLEDQYFGDGETETIRTRAAAPKRRSN